MTTASRRAQRKREPSRGDLREQRILEVAERQLDEQGFDGMTMDAIAKGVGIARSALYFYFDSKQSVAIALVEAIYDELVAPIREVPVDADTDELISDTIDRVAELWRQHTAVMCFAAQRSSDMPRIGELWQQTMDRWLTATLAVLRSQPGSAATEAHVRALNSMVERTLWRFYSEPYTSDEEHALLQAVKDIIGATVKSLGESSRR
ncbi:MULTISPECIES: TetR/AcrR family transcriptional regulator [Nocardia]|uniref:TetR/AcrR family transcriptional regulator n=1 Tax=Nocardia TaxID=1817 RepID=UPI0024589FE1|nr:MULTISPECIES: helix-turn-helix domain-containing protein [Nocardia]